jgi:hypothetical protein
MATVALIFLHLTLEACHLFSDTINYPGILAPIPRIFHHTNLAIEVEDKVHQNHQHYPIWSHITAMHILADPPLAALI